MPGRERLGVHCTASTCGLRHFQCFLCRLSQLFIFDLFGPFLTTLFPTFLPLSTVICLSRPPGLQALFYLATFLSPQEWLDLVLSTGDCKLAHLLLLLKSNLFLIFTMTSKICCPTLLVPPHLLLLFPWSTWIPMASHWIYSPQISPQSLLLQLFLFWQSAKCFARNHCSPLVRLWYRLMIYKLTSLAP